MIYLAEKADKLLPNERVKERSSAAADVSDGGVGPTMGQANVFYRYFPEKIQPRDRSLPE